jgi:outer membrane protein assembly factor BamB
VLAAGTLYVTGCSAQGVVAALRASDGRVLWRLADDASNCATSLVVAGERLYAIGQGSLRAFAAQEGTLVWDDSLLDPGVTETSGGTAYGAEQAGVLYASHGSVLDALRTSDGHRLWRHESNRNVGFRAPVAFAGVLFVTTYVVYPHSFGISCPPNCEPPDALDALSSADGTVYWRVPMPTADPLFLIGDAP